MSEGTMDSNATPVSNVIQIDEDRVRGHLDRIVRSSVEETLNGLLDAEADRLVAAGRLLSALYATLLVTTLAALGFVKVSVLKFLFI